MKVSNVLKKQFVVEIFALLLLIGIIIYAFYAVTASNKDNISQKDGFVTVLDDKNFKELKILSDGAGFSSEGIIYTITNNNAEDKEYKVIIIPDSHDEKVLESIRVGYDDLGVQTLSDLEKIRNGYIISTHKLKAGFTDIHNIKVWYKTGTSESVRKTNVKFKFDIDVE